MRESGILMPIFSLPGPYGIGCFSEEAYRFVDFLREAGQRVWQVLPLNPTGYGDSPYQPLSLFAGNPYFIDLRTLMKKGLLTKEECAGALSPASCAEIDYGRLYRERIPLLHLAFTRSNCEKNPEFLKFCEENEDWLSDYALFMACKDAHGGVGTASFREMLRRRDPSACAEAASSYAERILFYRFLQYEFEAEWRALRAYANGCGIRILGDMGIYASADSADFWAHPELFLTDQDRRMTEVAGCPPDSFSEAGQLWGNPVYAWEAHQKTGYRWWLRRLLRARTQYDAVRIDHFRGFEAFYAVPAGAKDAKHGVWRKGPGMDFFRAVSEAVPDFPIFAEDLGLITEEVRALVRQSGCHGMKVLEFAFEAGDLQNKNPYLPCNYDSRCVVYTGTHDNETLIGYLDGLDAPMRRRVMSYLNEKCGDSKVLAERLIRLAQSSAAELCVIPLWDYLGYGNEARINTPGSCGKSWRWRLPLSAFPTVLAEKIRRLTRLYGREE